jgi:hypothetical protein
MGSPEEMAKKGDTAEVESVFEKEEDVLERLGRDLEEVRERKEDLEAGGDIDTA